MLQSPVSDMTGVPGGPLVAAAENELPHRDNNTFFKIPMAYRKMPLKQELGGKGQPQVYSKASAATFTDT